MKTSTMIWIVLFVLGGAFLFYRAVLSEQGMGKAYVRGTPVAVDAQHPEGRWTRYEGVTPRVFVEARSAPGGPNQTKVQFSPARTIGTWIAAFLTLAIFSFLYKDNPFYKLAEAILIGVSAAYWMVVGFWDVVVPNLIGRLLPLATKAWALPGLADEDLHRNWWYLVPLVLGIMLLWRLAPSGGWIARWPLAFIIGTTAGIRLIGFIHGDFLAQIRNNMVPLLVMENGAFSPWDSVANILLFVGVLACLVYFFFSFEHRGVVGGAARLGIWFLMITFGAAFGYTVMGRIALLAIRLEFLFDDWLWLIDPSGKRAAVVAQATAAMLGIW